MSDYSSDFPILENLNKTMRCGILTNSKGDILILHDQPLADPVDYIEYDPRDETFVLIFENGRIQDIGIDIDNKMMADLLHGSQVTLGYFVAKKIQATQVIVFLVKEY